MEDSNVGKKDVSLRRKDPKIGRKGFNLGKKDVSLRRNDVNLGDMETPQHGNDSTRKLIKNTRKPLKNRFF